MTGTTQTCACTATLSGVQSCGADGTFGACACDGFDAGPEGRDGGTVDGGDPSDDGGAVDGGGTGNDPCSCTWGGRIPSAGADTTLFVHGVTSAGDLVYSENPPGADNTILHIVGCMGATSTLRASDVGGPAGALSMRAILPNDVLVVMTGGASEGTGRLVYWDHPSNRSLASIDGTPVVTLHGLPDGRGHTIVRTGDSGTSGAQVYEEYDETGTRLRDVTTQVVGNDIIEPLAQGWLVDVAGAPQQLLDGALTATTRSLPPMDLAKFHSYAGTPLEDGRRFVQTDELVSGVLEMHYSEIDPTTSAVIWDASYDIEQSSGRPTGQCRDRAVATPMGNWLVCRFGENALLPDSAPPPQTTYVLRFDPTSGAELNRHVYSAGDGDRCIGTAFVVNIVSDRCGGIYASAVAPEFSVRQCQTLSLPNDINEQYVIDHYGPDGVRD